MNDTTLPAGAVQTTPATLEPVAVPPKPIATIPPFPWTVAVPLLVVAERTWAGLLALLMFPVNNLAWSQQASMDPYFPVRLGELLFGQLFLSAVGIWGIFAVTGLWKPSARGWTIAFLGVQLLLLRTLAHVLLVGLWTPHAFAPFPEGSFLPPLMQGYMVMQSLLPTLLLVAALICLAHPASLAWSKVAPNGARQAWRGRWYWLVGAAILFTLEALQVRARLAGDYSLILQ